MKTLRSLAVTRLLVAAGSMTTVVVVVGAGHKF
jgi:pheromone shutdown protein TraB